MACYSITLYFLKMRPISFSMQVSAETVIKGEWKVSAEITCTRESLKTESLGKTIGSDCVLKEVAVQSYEIQVVIEEPKGTTPPDDYFIVVFDDKGRYRVPEGELLRLRGGGTAAK